LVTSYFILLKLASAPELGDEILFIHYVRLKQYVHIKYCCGVIVQFDPYINRGNHATVLLKIQIEANF